MTRLSVVCQRCRKRQLTNMSDFEGTRTSIRRLGISKPNTAFCPIFHPPQRLSARLSKKATTVFRKNCWRSKKKLPRSRGALRRKSGPFCSWKSISSQLENQHSFRNFFFLDYIYNAHNMLYEHKSMTTVSVCVPHGLSVVSA